LTRHSQVKTHGEGDAEIGGAAEIGADDLADERRLLLLLRHRLLHRLPHQLLHQLLHRLLQ
jgi:hypothetical protein